MDLNYIYDLIFSFLQMTLFVAFAPLFSGIIKKTKALLQNRTGADITQDYYDLYKWWGKKTVVTPYTGLIFLLAPFMYLLSTMLAAFLLPNILNNLTFGDIFVFVSLLAIGRFFMALSSFDAATAFGGMGGSREIYVSTFAEPAIFLAVLSLILKNENAVISGMIFNGGTQINVAGILACVGFFILMLTENGRIPVDNPDTHLELTMIHECMLLEYSGRLLAVIHLASMVKALLFMTLFSMVFLPLSLPLLVKVILTSVSIALMETLNNKMRLFKIRAYLLATGGLLLLAIVAQ
ncbi:MAG: hydrogenase [Negativicutes bacterium]|nr:hydrogenase [Negativicutes bacterium]